MSSTDCTGQPFRLDFLLMPLMVEGQQAVEPFAAGEFGGGIHQYQSSQSKPGARLNSRVLWVTRIAWCAKAVPAIR